MATPVFYPLVGGTENSTLNLAIELNNQGVHTDVATVNNVERNTPLWQFRSEKFKNFTLYKIPAIRFSSFSRYKILNRLLGINQISLFGFHNLLRKYDIIHYQDDNDMTLVLSSFWASSKKIMHYRSFVEQTHKKYDNNFFLKILSKNIFDLHIGNSKFTKSRLINYFGQSVDYLDNSVHEDFFKRREQLKKKNSIICVGRIEKTKGVQFFLSSLLLVKEQCEVKIIGDFVEDDYKRKILEISESIMEKRNIKIIFYSSMKRKDLIPLIQESTLLVFPWGSGFNSKINSGSGIVQMESMASGTPVITTNTGANPGIVKHGKTGLVVERNNIKEFAAAISYLLQNRTFSKKLGINAKSYAEENFRLKKQANKLIKKYERLL